MTLPLCDPSTCCSRIEATDALISSAEDLDRCVAEAADDVCMAGDLVLTPLVDGPGFAAVVQTGEARPGEVLLTAVTLYKGRSSSKMLQASSRR